MSQLAKLFRQRQFVEIPFDHLLRLLNMDESIEIKTVTVSQSTETVCIHFDRQMPNGHGSGIRNQAARVPLSTVLEGAYREALDL